jgi:hypothetical protein
VGRRCCAERASLLAIGGEPHVYSRKVGSVRGMPLAHSGQLPVGHAWLCIVSVAYKGTESAAGMVVPAWPSDSRAATATGIAPWSRGCLEQAWTAVPALTASSAMARGARLRGNVERLGVPLTQSGRQCAR